MAEYDLESTEQSRSLYFIVPPGIVIMYAGESIPDGYVTCEGQLLRRPEYPHLYDAIGTKFGGTPDLFRVPNLRTLFLRGASGSRPVGTAEDDAIKDHDHQITYQGQFATGDFSYLGFTGAIENSGGDLLDNPTVRYVSINTTNDENLSGFGNESRPENVSLRYIMRYRP